MTEKLKTCPFCGSEAGIEVEDEEFHAPNDDLIHRVICTRCCGNTGWYFSPEEAVRAWNMRV